MRPLPSAAPPSSKRATLATARLYLAGGLVAAALFVTVGVRPPTETPEMSTRVSEARAAAQNLVDQAIQIANSQSNNVSTFPSSAEHLYVALGQAAYNATATRRYQIQKTMEPRIQIQALTKKTAFASADAKLLSQLRSGFMDYLALTLQDEGTAAILAAGGAEIAAIDGAYDAGGGTVVVNVHVVNGYGNGTPVALDMVQDAYGEWNIANARTTGLLGTGIFGFDLQQEFQRYVATLR